MPETLSSQPEYHRALAGQGRQIGRGLLAILLVFVGLFGIGGAVTWVGAQVDLGLGNRNPTVGGEDYTAVFHASNTLGIALVIPWVMLVQRWLFGVRGRTLISVVSGLRYEIFGRWLLIIGPVAVGTMALLALITPAETMTWSIAQLTGVVTVTLLITPLQAAAEEFGFRGLIFRAASNWAHGPRASLVTGVVVSTALFMLMHPPLSPWLAISQTGLAVGAALITWRTGGLEIAILLHALNNVLSQLYAQVLHSDLLTTTVEPTILLTLVPTAVATMIVFLGSRGQASPTFMPEALRRGSLGRTVSRG